MVTPGWKLRKVDEARAAELALGLGVLGPTARALLGRGVVELEAARRYLTPRLGDLRSPEAPGAAMAGFDAAVTRLARALAAGERVGIFGDYDVDGVTSTAVLASFLRALGGDVTVRVARRDGGYGFGTADADALADAGARVVVTCDLGTSDVASISALRARAIDVIVVDHHQVPDDVARHPASALINPHRADDRFPFKGLCSAGIAFYLAAALRTRLRAAAPTRGLPDPRELLDLVAIGTICDLAPLTHENRILVHHGLKMLAARRRPGLRALLTAAGIDVPGTLAPARALTEIDVGFKLGPRLNAPGRLGSAEPALELLLAASDDEAAQRAAAIDLVNKDRQRIQDEVLIQAVAAAEAAGGAAHAAIVVAGEGWSPGVVGIVAAKLVERYRRPAIVIALAGGEGRGSARSHGGLHLYRALARCSDHLTRYGGHAAAAGLSLAEASLPGFITAFRAAAAEVGGSTEEALELDCSLDGIAIDERLVGELARLAPFGIGNPEPLLGLSGLRVRDSRVVGERHLKLTVVQSAGEGERSFGAIAFRMAERDPGADAVIDLAFRPEVDEFRGQRRVQLVVRDLVLTGEAARVPATVVATGSGPAQTDAAEQALP